MSDIYIESPLSNIERSHHGETTGSHPNSEVKHHWACSVLRWGTTRESQVLVRFYLLLPKPYPYLKFYVPFTHQVADPVAQWLRRVTTNHEIGGSSPSRVAFSYAVAVVA